MNTAAGVRRYIASNGRVFVAIQDGTMSPAKVEAMVKANAVEWDIVNFTGGFMHAGTEKGLLIPVDRAVVDQSVLEPALRKDHGTYTHSGGVVMAWNTKKYGEDKGTQSWADFFDVRKFPGSRALYKSPEYLCEATLRATGLKLGEIYPLTDEKMKIVFAKLKEFKPHVSLWYTQGAVPAQALATGQIDLALTTTGRILIVKGEGAPVAFNMKDGLINCFALMVPKGTPYAKAAMQLMAASIEESAQTKLLTAGSYGPVRTSVIAKATPEQRRYLAFTPENRKSMLLVNYAESARVAAKYSSEWTTFFAGWTVCSVFSLVIGCRFANDTSIFDERVDVASTGGQSRAGYCISEIKCHRGSAAIRF